MIKVDRYDLKILAALMQDGRMTKSKLADTINLSVAACSERVKRLEDSGIIRGYHVDLDINKLCPNIYVYVEITLNKHSAHELQQFEQLLRHAPEITHCVATGGGVDYIFIVNTQTIQDYQEFIDKILDQCDYIEKYFTYIVTKWIKNDSINATLVSGF